MITMVKAAAALTAAPVLALSLAGTAEASDRWTYRSTSSNAVAEWIEFGALPGGVQGNIHVGYLEVYGSGSTEVFGSVADWTCPDGELPPSGGGPHGLEEEEPEPTNCTLHSERFIFGEDVAFSMDRKLGSATLTGQLSVQDHEGGLSGQPAVNMTWTGIGEVSSWSSTSKYTEGGSTYYVKEVGSSRQAEVSGFIGAMGFTDDADDQSTGYLSTSKYYERSVSR
jgi:hypothetical protein